MVDVEFAILAERRPQPCQQPNSITVDRSVSASAAAARAGCRWDGGNNPEQTDFVSVRNLVRACPPGLQRFVLTTSAGVERSGQFPFSILNLFGALQLLGLTYQRIWRGWWLPVGLRPQGSSAACVAAAVGRRCCRQPATSLLPPAFPPSASCSCCPPPRLSWRAGVLKYKRMGEQELEASGLPYTIVRPNRLTDGGWVTSLSRVGKGVLHGVWIDGSLQSAVLLVLAASAPAAHLLTRLPVCLLSPPASAPLAAPPLHAGPYTSYDINTLIKNTSGKHQDVTLSLKDNLQGEASRIAGTLAPLV